MLFTPLGVLGAVFGAFLGAVVASYLGVVAERGWRGSADGRSVCVCGRQLRGIENIPVVSWLALRGRSSCCGSPIPVRYVVSEATLAAAVGAGAAVGGAAPAAVVLVAGGFVVLASNRSSAHR